MGEIAGSILRDLRAPAPHRLPRQAPAIVRSLPKSAYAGIQSLFGRKIETSGT